MPWQAPAPDEETPEREASMAPSSLGQARELASLVKGAGTQSKHPMLHRVF